MVLEHQPDRVDFVEVLFRKDPELARAIVQRHRRIIRRLRDRLSEFLPPEEIQAILWDEDLELIESAFHQN